MKKSDNPPPPKVDLPNTSNLNPPVGQGNPPTDKTDAFKKNRFDAGS